MRLPALSVRTLSRTKLALVLCLAMFLPAIVFASTAADQFRGGASTAGDNAGYDISPANNDISAKVGRYIGIALSLLGVFFLILMIYGGFKWMNARGQEANLTKAKSTIRNAIIGLAIVLAAYAITYYVGSAINSAIDVPAPPPSAD